MSTNWRDDEIPSFQHLSVRAETKIVNRRARHCCLWPNYEAASWVWYILSRSAHYKLEALKGSTTRSLTTTAGKKRTTKHSGAQIKRQALWLWMTLPQGTKTPQIGTLRKNTTVHESYVLINCLVLSAGKLVGRISAQSLAFYLSKLLLKYGCRTKNQYIPEKDVWMLS